jgi:hypothetical protein
MKSNWNEIEKKWVFEILEIFQHFNVPPKLSLKEKTLFDAMKGKFNPINQVYLNHTRTDHFLPKVLFHLNREGLIEKTEEGWRFLKKRATVLRYIDFDRYRLSGLKRNPTALRIIEDALEDYSQGKNFTKLDLESLTDWNYHVNEKNLLRFPDGFGYQEDSKTELEFIKYLYANQYALVVRGQDLKIPRIDGGYYKPDFVLLDYKKRIVIVEVKGLNAISQYETLIKYVSGKEYCRKNNFAFLFVDETRKNMKWYLTAEIKPCIKETFNSLISRFGYANQKIIRMIQKQCQYSNMNQKTYNNYIQALIIQEGYINRSNAKGNIEIDLSEKMPSQLLNAIKL